MKKLIVIMFIAAMSYVAYISYPNLTGNVVYDEISVEILAAPEKPKINLEKFVSETEIQDLCDDIKCKDSLLTCLDGFVESCKNTCSGGLCSNCLPNCDGHREVEVIEEVTPEPKLSEELNNTEDPTDSEVPEVPIILYPIINEIMYHPIQDDNYNEWVEIYNPSSHNIDLTDWTICGKQLLPGYVKHEDGNIYSDKGMIIFSKGYALITDGGSGTNVYENFNVGNSLAMHVDAGSICGRLSNSGKTITLENSTNEIDSVTYTNEFANGNGKSLELVSDGLWTESISEEGTPGSVNNI